MAHGDGADAGKAAAAKVPEWQVPDEMPSSMPWLEVEDVTLGCFSKVSRREEFARARSQQMPGRRRSVRGAPHARHAPRGVPPQASAGVGARFERARRRYARPPYSTRKRRAHDNTFAHRPFFFFFAAAAAASSAATTTTAPLCACPRRRKIRSGTSSSS